MIINIIFHFINFVFWIFFVSCNNHKRCETNLIFDHHHHFNHQFMFCKLNFWKSKITLKRWPDHFWGTDRWNHFSHKTFLTNTLQQTNKKKINFETYFWNFKLTDSNILCFFCIFFRYFVIFFQCDGHRLFQIFSTERISSEIRTHIIFACNCSTMIKSILHFVVSYCCNNFFFCFVVSHRVFEQNLSRTPNKQRTYSISNEKKNLTNLL